MFAPPNGSSLHDFPDVFKSDAVNAMMFRYIYQELILMQ